MQLIELSIHRNTAVIRLNRPQKAHAYTDSMLQELSEKWKQVESQATIAIIESTGNKHFCAGADLNEMKSKDAQYALDLPSQYLFKSIASSPVISIVAIDGPAIAGGFELALAADLRVMHPDAWCALPEVSLGLIPSAGGCTRLSSIIGSSRAKSIILGGDRITAQQALDWGVAHSLDSNPKAFARSWAERISEYDPLALRLAKEVLEEPSLQKERLAEAILYSKRHTND